MILLPIMLYLFHTAYAIPIKVQQYSYDHISITSSWKAIYVTWSSGYGKHYMNHAILLRPTSFIKQHHLHVKGSADSLNPTWGISSHATIVSMIPCKTPKQTKGAVIGVFKHYTNTVNIYTFSDNKGHQTQLRATPNHRVYVVDQIIHHQIIPIHRFMAIHSITHTMEVINDHHTTMHLTQVILDNTHTIQAVYNLEVYQRHIYYVGHDGVLVHNGNCKYKCYICDLEFKNQVESGRHFTENHIFLDPETREKKFVCPVLGCEKVTYPRVSDLQRHHITKHLERFIQCPLCQESNKLTLFAGAGGWREHMLHIHPNESRPKNATSLQNYYDISYFSTQFNIPEREIRANQERVHHVRKGIPIPPLKPSISTDYSHFTLDDVADFIDEPPAKKIRTDQTDEQLAQLEDSLPEELLEH